VAKMETRLGGRGASEMEGWGTVLIVS